MIAKIATSSDFARGLSSHGNCMVYFLLSQDVYVVDDIFWFVLFILPFNVAVCTNAHMHVYMHN